MVAVMLVTSCTDAVAVALMKLEVLVITRSVAFTGKAKDVEVRAVIGHGEHARRHSYVFFDDKPGLKAQQHVHASGHNPAPQAMRRGIKLTEHPKWYGEQITYGDAHDGDGQQKIENPKA